MNRRNFFGFLRAAPVALPAMVLNGGQKLDGVQPDGKTLYLNGRKVMEATSDGSISIGENGNITLLGKQAMIELHASPQSE